MRSLKTSEAAALLNVSPNTLRAWEQRFGFPRPQRTPGHHRLFTYGEIVALRDALKAGLSISSAISSVRQGLAADSRALVGALLSYDAGRADDALAATLALRSVEQAVQEVLLPALGEILRRHTTESAPWAFAAPWSADWLRRARRLAASPARPGAILIGDASRDELDPDAVHIRTLELFCSRGGIGVLTLSARGAAGIAEAVARWRPDAIVLAGGSLPDDDLARWAYAVKLAAGAPPACVYRRSEGKTQLRRTALNWLPPDAAEAQQRLLEIVDQHSTRGTHPTAPRAVLPPLYTGADEVGYAAHLRRA
jgi:DNA-binding transcriptional MerR regulator